MDVYVVRHGQTDWNVAGRLQGATDVPLNQVGRKQAAASASALSLVLRGSACVVTSPLVRARHTADAIAEALGTRAHVDGRLAERAYGIWEGLDATERESRWPAEVRQWRMDGTANVEGFEHHETVRERVAAALEEWAERADKTLVVVTHGSAARVGMQGVLGLSLAHRTLGNLGNAAWSRLTHRGPGDWTLEQHNVTPELWGERA